MSGLAAFGAVLMLYGLALMARCMIDLRRLYALMARNEELGRRIGLTRYTSTPEAFRELEAIRRGMDEIEEELDGFTTRRMFTLGVWS